MEKVEESSVCEQSLKDVGERTESKKKVPSCGFSKPNVEKKYRRRLQENRLSKSEDPGNPSVMLTLREFPLILCVIVFVCTGREPRQKKASTTPG